MSVTVETRDRVTVVTIDRPQVKNAIDAPAARALAQAFRAFDADPQSDVAILTGSGGTFSAGADLKAFAEGSPDAIDPLRSQDPDADGPLGCTRLQLSKPVVAAVEGYAVAGGLELALWCDLRVAARGAVFGVFCRRFGVPLIDGGTVRLTRAVGVSRALDMILTGRAVGAEEALLFGLANRVVDDGHALAAAHELARAIARFPQSCLRNDRQSVYDQWPLSIDAALRNEYALGMQSLHAGEAAEGARAFASGEGRHGRVRQA